MTLEVPDGAEFTAKLISMLLKLEQASSVPRVQSPSALLAMGRRILGDKSCLSGALENILL